MSKQALYHRLSMTEREEISRLLATGQSFRAIARHLGRSPGSISREVNQKWFDRDTYRACIAQIRARKRRSLQGRKSKLGENPRLSRLVIRKLRLYWSPEQIVRYLKKRYPTDMNMRVSPETIYAAIYILPKGELKKSLTKALRQQHTKRYTRKPKNTVRPTPNIPSPLSIEQRPAEVETRQVAGHWEGDLIIGKWKQSALGTLVERKTRYTKLIPLQAKDHVSVRQGIEKWFNYLPSKLKASLTWDQGGEMSSHQILTAKTKVKVYFAHPASPWERGTNENTNMLVRQFFPKGTDFNKVSKKEVKYVEKLLNDRPRKCLNWASPQEAFKKEVLR